MYAGIRHGELRALRADKIDLALSVSRFDAGWDQYEGEIDTEDRKGATYDDHHRLPRRRCSSSTSSEPAEAEATSSSAEDIDTAVQPEHSPQSRQASAGRIARRREDEEDTIPEHERIRPIGLHDCRHTAVSHMLDAGITIDKVSKFMGHASITVTIDRYGHLLPGGEAEAAEILNEYHVRRRQQRTPVAV